MGEKRFLTKEDVTVEEEERSKGRIRASAVDREEREREGREEGMEFVSESGAVMKTDVVETMEEEERGGRRRGGGG